MPGVRERALNPVSDGSFLRQGLVPVRGGLGQFQFDLWLALTKVALDSGSIGPRPVARQQAFDLRGFQRPDHLAFDGHPFPLSLHVSLYARLRSCRHPPRVGAHLARRVGEAGGCADLGVVERDNLQNLNVRVAMNRGDRCCANYEFNSQRVSHFALTGGTAIGAERPARA
ncbi:hypothetical protein D3C85_1268660 [compost metagenome]